jgi:hypothetical protein
MRKLTAIVIVLFLIFVVAGFAVSPLVDSHFNKTLRKPPYRVNEAA